MKSASFWHACRRPHSFFTSSDRQCVGVCITTLARMNRAWTVEHVQADVDDVSFLVRRGHSRDAGRDTSVNQSINQLINCKKYGRKIPDIYLPSLQECFYGISSIHKNNIQNSTNHFTSISWHSKLTALTNPRHVTPSNFLDFLDSAPYVYIANL